jgi:hypothetical protein
VNLNQAAVRVSREPIALFLSLTPESRDDALLTIARMIYRAASENRLVRTICYNNSIVSIICHLSEPTSGRARRTSVARLLPGASTPSGKTRAIPDLRSNAPCFFLRFKKLLRSFSDRLSKFASSGSYYCCLFCHHFLSSSKVFRFLVKCY